jgi:hypothetical protein
MLLERRAYTLRPGAAVRFWELQREWQNPQQVRPMIERTIGYFVMLAGPGEEIVHLYRYDSYDDWRARLFGTYRPERAAYYTAARALLLAQENAFYELAPVDALNPLWHAGRDWLPGVPAFPGVADPSGLTIVESMVDLLPGGLLTYWQAWREHGLAAGAVAVDRLIGTFYSLIGRQHRVLQYRWYHSEDGARAHRAALERDPHWLALAEATRPMTLASRHALLQPSPVPWQQALFTALEWA